MKRKIIYGVILSWLLVGCGKVDPVSEKMMNDINSIGEVTIEDEELINNLLDIYATLTEKQKEQVDNYVVLLEAENSLDELKKQEIQSEVVSETRAYVQEEETLDGGYVYLDDYKLGFLQDFPITLNKSDALGERTVTINNFSYNVSSVNGLMTIEYKIDYTGSSTNDIWPTLNASIGLYDKNGNYIDGISCFFDTSVTTNTGILVIEEGVQDYDIEFSVL